MPFRKLTEQRIYRDQVLGLRIDTVETSEGDILSRKVVEYQKSAAVVPVLEDGHVMLVRHYRHPVGKELWDIPGGVIEAGESPVVAAMRELEEETGYAAGRLSRIFEFHPEPAFADHEIFLYRAEALRGASRVNEEREILDCRSFGRAELLHMLSAGKILSSWSVIGLLIYIGEFDDFFDKIVGAEEHA